jgi:hypothetical protein
MSKPQSEMSEAALRMTAALLGLLLAAWLAAPRPSLTRSPLNGPRPVSVLEW